MTAAKRRSLVHSVTTTSTRRTAIRLVAPRRSASTPMMAMQGMQKAVTAHGPRAASTVRTAPARTHATPSSRITPSKPDMTKAMRLGAAGMPKRAMRPAVTSVTTAMVRAAIVLRMLQTTIPANHSAKAPDTRKTRMAPPARTRARSMSPPMQPMMHQPRSPRCLNHSRAWSSSCSQTPSTR